jgi:dCTP deaminase
MILCNEAVQRALDDGRLIISPEPTPRRPTVGGGHCPYDTHTVDLRLAAEISVPIGEGVASIDLARPGMVANFIQRNSRTFIISEIQPFILEPNKFVLGRTMESVGLPIKKTRKRFPTCLAARIEGKSSRARFGLLIHFTAPTVHPGWELAPLTLEMINLGAWPIQLTLGMAIAQLIVEEVSGIPFENASQFQGQTTPAGVVSSPRGSLSPTVSRNGDANPAREKALAKKRPKTVKRKGRS